MRPPSPPRPAAPPSFPRGARGVTAHTRFARSPLLGFLLASVGIASALSCTDVPVDGVRDDHRLLPSRGAIRGTVRYEGPLPCTERGHVVGGAIVEVFSKASPPPPAGTATRPVNFVYLPGDLLFPSLPRAAGARICPAASELITATASYAISPLNGGSYELHAFYSRSGNYRPTFSVRNGIEAGDVRGGYIDSASALSHRGDPEFPLTFLPVEIGLPAAGDPSVPGARTTFSVPPEGYLADDVSVILAFPTNFPRPFFHLRGGEELASTKVLEIPQDIAVRAAPATSNSAAWAALEASYPKVSVDAFFPPLEADAALAEPFVAQLFSPANGGGLQLVARGGDAPLIPGLPYLGPRFTAVRLDPTALTDNGFPLVEASPRVEMRGFALDGPMETTALNKPPLVQGVGAARSTIPFLVEPLALCTQPNGPTTQATIALPHPTVPSATPAEGEKALVTEDALRASYTNTPLAIETGCLPLGTYAVTLAYNNGQSWTLPNEAGSCVTAEGTWDPARNPAYCNGQVRPVLRSQGVRGLIEVVPPKTTEGIAYCAAHPVPAACVSAR